MKVAILAGGHGTRLAEETEIKPKPMVEIGGRPMLWHIMMTYAHYGYKDFVVALGYKGEVIKKYMVDYRSLCGNITVNLGNGDCIHHEKDGIDWSVELIETGLHTQTGGRIKRLAPHVGNETFMLTWGDGLSNINLNELLSFHRAHGKLATLTAVRPPARYGHLELNGDSIEKFSEKPQTGEGWINGAFFVLEPKAFDYIEGDETRNGKKSLWRIWRETSSSWPLSILLFGSAWTPSEKNIYFKNYGTPGIHLGKSGTNLVHTMA